MLFALALLAAAIGATAPAVGPAAAQSESKPLPYHEVLRPDAKAFKRSPRGVVQVIHGGSWEDVGARQVRRTRAVADWFRARGFVTLNHTYRAGSGGIADVWAFYGLAREVAGRRRPVCVWGGSSGAHWATLLATQRPVDCTIAEGLPTLLVEPKLEALKPKSRLTLSIFGGTEAERSRWSPVAYADELRGPVLVGIGKADPLTPPKNGTLMRQARPDLVSFSELDPGGCPFVHVSVDCRQRTEFRRRTAALLDRAVARRADR